MREVVGYLINPQIPTSLEDLRIADVGTGTAAWALETAVKYENAAINGFDKSDEQFSPLYSVSNVRLVIHNCFEPLPPEFLGQYHVIHARFWLCLMNNPDAPVMLKNLMTLLSRWFHRAQS
ncbi:hypothetical protein MMC08_009047 [Hypocenomyce scalaris]|nr:hypothetical protein [Hypocenomyce scalaris]